MRLGGEEGGDGRVLDAREMEGAGYNCLFSREGAAGTSLKVNLR